MANNQKTVMIVEDEPDAAELFAEMMRVSGYRVLKSHASAPAIRLIAQEKPDVVILDIMMPDISGLEILGYMRREIEPDENSGGGGLSQKPAVGCAGGIGRRRFHLPHQAGGLRGFAKRSRACVEGFVNRHEPSARIYRGGNPILTSEENSGINSRPA